MTTPSTDTIQRESHTSVLHPETLPRIEAALREAATRAGRTALVDGTWSLDYGSLAEWAEQFAVTLRAKGLRDHDRVSLFFDKTPESVAALYGVWLAGGVAVPINGGLRSRQIEHIVRHSESHFLVSTERKRGALKSAVLEAITQLEVESLRESSGSSGEGLHRPNTASADELAAILYTSGSTGLPKGVAVSHANLCAGVRIVARYLGLRDDERILSVLPFSFDYGLNQLLTAVERVATLVLHRSPLPADICRALSRHEITGLAGVPPLWVGLLQAASPFSKMSLPHLRYITNSGGALPVAAVAALRRILPGAKIFLMYGFTEAFRSTYLSPEEVDRHPTSMGRAIPECEVWVISADGRPCGTGATGELVHRGPTVSMGYWRDPEATAAKFRPNPFAPDSGERVAYSGDLVQQDEEGFLYFVGRRDEMIKSYGHRISPNEVEEVILASGRVAEVVAKGIPDPIAGMVVVAHCVPISPDAFSVQELLAYCRKEMPSHMVPKSFFIHAALPRTASGKIDRKSVGE